MSLIKENLISTRTKISEILKSSQGRDILLFVLFLLISFLFWLILTLNNEGQRDVEIPIKLVGIPDSITLINSMPASINVNVRDKGTSLIRYEWGKIPSINLKFKDYNNGKNRIIIGESDLNKQIRTYFGTSAQLLSLKPDSISLSYSTCPGKKVALKLITDVQPNFQYIISGPITADIDSVYLYSVDNNTADLQNYVETIPLIRSDLKDTTKVVVQIAPIKNSRIIPNQVTVTIPVEPLIAKRQTISLIPENVPHGVNLITFPAKIEVSYLLPMSRYNNTHQQIKAYIDYLSIKSGQSKIPIYVRYDDSEYHNLSYSPDSVEFIIEQTLK